MAASASQVGASQVGDTFGATFGATSTSVDDTLVGANTNVGDTVGGVGTNVGDTFEGMVSPTGGARLAMEQQIHGDSHGHEGDAGEALVGG